MPVGTEHRFESREAKSEAVRPPVARNYLLYLDSLDLALHISLFPFVHCSLSFLFSAP